MKFKVEVGEFERHMVELSFNQLFGTLVIKIDEAEIKRTRRIFDEPIRETHTFPVGHTERIHLRIEKERKMLFGHRWRVFLNERLLKCFTGV